MSEVFVQVLQGQAHFCRENGSPFTAQVLDVAARDIARGGPFAALAAPWSAAPPMTVVEEAAPLRLSGALNALRLDGRAPDLAALYPPNPPPDPVALETALLAAAAEHGAWLSAFMGSPPQTNEARRAMGLFGGFGEVAARTGLPLATFEIGASAGLLTAWDRFAYAADDRAWRWGDPASPVALSAAWSGPPPPLGPIVVESRRACDVAPVDVRSPEALQRLRAYVWPDQADRLAVLEGAARLRVAEGIEVEAADAGEWLSEHLRPRPGVATVLYHSVMFQYLPMASRDAVHRAVIRAAAEATAQAPFAWLRFEPAMSAAPRNMEVRLALWPSAGDRLLARAQPHGASVEWLGAPDPGAAPG